MTAAQHDIVIEQGATFTLNLLWKDANDTPINLTGYTARMQVRHKFTDGTALVSFSTAAGTITLGGSAGTIAVSGLATLSNSLVRSGVYDLELENAGGVVTRLVEGKVTIKPEVTR